MEGLQFIFRPFDKGLRTILGSLEAEVMEVVWASGVVSARDVHRRLAQRRPLAYTTVITTLVRLARKRFVVRDKADGPYLYAPAVSRDQLAKEVTDSVMNGLLEGFGTPAAAQFLDRLRSREAQRGDGL